MHREPLCANCGIHIRWQPTTVDGRTYCCSGCAEGGPCRCDYDNLPAVGEVQALVRIRAQVRALDRPHVHQRRPATD